MTATLRARGRTDRGGSLPSHGATPVASRAERRVLPSAARGDGKTFCGGAPKPTTKGSRVNDRQSPVSEIISLYQEGLITKGEARALLTRYFPEIGQLALAAAESKTA